ncbi:hypothetical protein NXT3_PA00207 (plasmid) [Sinorhizobium fredii]|uniref:Uncharacterized protein n=1 Tax=Rhizobium fredii TaxID=380 RepID=A0A2L0HAQ8_RHIFR|nr:hypothetical protein NXT3_PA00207 [Sinorhizobium fredii]
MADERLTTGSDWNGSKVAAPKATANNPRYALTPSIRSSAGRENTIPKEGESPL